MPEEYRWLRNQLLMEQQRFLNFAMEASILYADGNICTSLQVNRSLLVAVLAEINMVFEQYASKNGKYVKELPQDDVKWNDSAEPEMDLMELLCLPSDAPELSHEGKGKRFKRIRQLGEGLLQAGRNIRTVVFEPKRLAWVVFDKESFEGLIVKLADLNSFLITLLDSSQVKRLRRAMDTSYQEILQTRNDIQSLIGLVEALKNDIRADGKHELLPDGNALALVAAEEQEAEAKKKTYLRRLAEIKIQYTRFGDKTDGQTIVSTKEPLALELFSFDGVARDSKIYMGRTNAEYQNRGVWIEWTEIPSSQLGTRVASAQAENRIRLLAELLCGEKPEHFRSPPCLGYVKAVNANDEAQYGIVFKKPTPGAPTTNLRTLRQLLKDRPKPSLSVRISLCTILAECIHNFHAVNWLHKGFRSENVIFFAPDGRQPELRAPYVSGFELSRPTDLGEMTEKPYFNPAQDIYRHPLAQSTQRGGNYRKSYDLYSLAITLIEIANWKRVDILFNIENVASAKPSDLRDIHRRLLEEPVHLQRIASKFGDIFKETVRVCLRADEREQPMEPGESDASVAVRLQRMLKEDVVRNLRSMETATRAEE